MNDNLKLTTVKVQNRLYSNFKSELAISDNGFTLQKLTNRSMDLYLNDEDFRNKIESYNKLNEEFKTKKL